MERFETSHRAATTRDAVWRVLTAADRVPEWFTIASSVTVDGTDGAVGQRLEVRGAHLGMDLVVPLTVDVADEPDTYGWHADRPIALTFRFALADDGTGGCDVTGRVEADTTGLPRLAVTVAVRSLRQQFARSLARLGDLAERA